MQIDVGDLRSAWRQVIPADWVNVRFVRSVRVPLDQKAKTFRREPFLLEERKTVSVAKNRGGGPMLLGRVSLDQCRFAFNPSRLAQGKYELKVELLDPRGEVVLARSCVVERIAD